MLFSGPSSTMLGRIFSIMVFYETLGSKIFKGISLSFDWHGNTWIFLEEHGASNRGSNKLSKKSIWSWSNSKAALTWTLFSDVERHYLHNDVLWNVLEKISIFYEDTYLANAMFENYKFLQRGKKPFIIVIFKTLKFLSSRTRMPFALFWICILLRRDLHIGQLEQSSHRDSMNLKLFRSAVLRFNVPRTAYYLSQWSHVRNKTCR